MNRDSKSSQIRYCKVSYRQKNLTLNKVTKKKFLQHPYHTNTCYMSVSFYPYVMLCEYFLLHMLFPQKHILSDINYSPPIITQPPTHISPNNFKTSLNYANLPFSGYNMHHQICWTYLHTSLIFFWQFDHPSVLSMVSIFPKYRNLNREELP